MYRLGFIRTSSSNKLSLLPVDAIFLYKVGSFISIPKEPLLLLKFAINDFKLLIATSNVSRVFCKLRFANFSVALSKLLTTLFILSLLLAKLPVIPLTLLSDFDNAPD